MYFNPIRSPTLKLFRSPIAPYEVVAERPKGVVGVLILRSDLN